VGDAGRLDSSFRELLERMLHGDEEAARLWRAFADVLRRRSRDFATSMEQHLSEHELREVIGLLLPTIGVGLRPSRRVELFRSAQGVGAHILPVHYHSPVPDTRELDPLDFRPRSSLLDDLAVDVASQLALLEQIARWADETREFPVDGPADSFHWGNLFFGELDAITYYCLIRELKPRRIVEVGGGYSTLLAARAAVHNGQTEIVCIDPNPVTEVVGGSGADVRRLAVPVQRLPPEFFDDLGRDDILFIDSSHVSKIGSDVNYLVLDVLPRLREGVVVHFHDVFLPAEYPRAWIDGLAFLNEQYLLAAFLLFNERFEVLALNHELATTQRPVLERLFRRPLPAEPLVEPASLWLRKRPLAASGTRA
jgi:hypothetical protein